MRNEFICPDDGCVCNMSEEDKHGQGCWLCPKIQNMRKNDKEECNFGESKDRTED